jgi:MinD-like ATPase involved in chromosome partitioning or flagellar assembly
VTPDPNDRPHHDDPEHEHGVLSDAGSVDTSTLGFLGGQTAQINVVLPAGSEDDLVDDDVIGDEVPVDASYAAGFDDEVAQTGELEEIDDSQSDATIEDAAFEDAAHDETIEDAVIEDDGEVEAQRDSANEGTLAPKESTLAENESTLAENESTLAREGGGAAEEAGGVPVPEVPAAVAAAAPITGSVPMTRRAQHPEPAERPTHAVERVIPRADVTMTSKRLGEFEAGRETADLLTADRLLDPSQVVRPEPEGVWQHFVYSISGHRINLGDGKRARSRKELDRRIAAPLSGGARFVPVLSRKGGVGKTTVTTLLGMALADARNDRIIAVDANPDRGTLAERISRSSGKTVRDLVKVRSEVGGYNDISGIVARDETRLDVLASDTDPRVSEALNDRDYHDIASLAAHYYSIVLTDTGTGIVHSVMGATLDLADQLVIVSGLSVDEARLASETLTWLETNGYSEQVRGAIVVLNTSRPGAPLVRPDELETHFRTRVRTVVRVPYDAHIAAGSAISFRDLQPATRLAARDLAASVVEGLRSLASAA